MNKVMSWLAWMLCASVVLGACISLALTLDQPNVRNDAFAAANALLNALYISAFGIVGALILSHQAGNRIGWLIMTIGVSLGTLGALQIYAAQAASASSTPSFAMYLNYWLLNWSWWLLVGPLLLILLLFPTGRLLSPRWRWVVTMIVVLFVISTLSILLYGEWHKAQNPLGIGIETFSFDTIAIPFVIALVATVALCVLSVAVRYRRAGGVEREQLKWFLSACALLLLSYVVGIFQGWSSAVDTNAFSLLADIAFLGVPVSIGVAILRYRLWDIDLIIRKTLIYSALTALLALIYVGGVVVFQQAFRAVIGHETDLAIVVSTLVIAALFFPLRRRVQNAIDRRFYRRKYDAAKTLAAFSATVRDEVELEKLTTELLKVVNETMQPAQVSLWLKDFNAKPSGREEAKV